MRYGLVVTDAAFNRPIGLQLTVCEPGVEYRRVIRGIIHLDLDLRILTGNYCVV